MLVIELPSDVVTAILESWIDMRSLAKLDSALCDAKS
jgi:hypothetical protein